MDLKRNLFHAVWCANELAKRELPELPRAARVVAYVPLVPLGRDFAPFNPNRNEPTALSTFKVSGRIYPRLPWLKHHAQTVIVHQNQFCVFHLGMTCRVEPVQDLNRCQSLVNTPPECPVSYQFVIIAELSMGIEK